MTLWQSCARDKNKWGQGQMSDFKLVKVDEMYTIHFVLFLWY
jgi:hypothetical protein